MAQLWNEWKIWLPLGLLIWQAVLSLVDFALCGWDKRCARLGRRRVPERRLLGGSLLAFAATMAGWLVNTRVLRYQYHYTSQEGIHFAAFDGERLEQLFWGWLESFGFRTGRM